MTKGFLGALGVAGLLLAFALQSLWAIRSKSSAYDENTMISGGISFWKTGDFRMANIDPPGALLLAGAPFLFSPVHLPLDHPSWTGRDLEQFAETLMYDAGNNPETLLHGARIPYLIVALILGLLIFTETGRLSGAPSSPWFALGLYAFSPTFLGYASLVSNDLLVSLFFFLATSSYWRFLKQGDKGHWWRATAWTFLGLCVKLTAFLIFPVVMIFLLGTAGLERWKRKTILLRAGDIGMSFGLSLGAFFLVFAGIHGSLMPILVRTHQFTAGGHAAFLLGRYSFRGWPSYYLVGILAKTPLPVLILIFLGAVSLFIQKRWSQMMALGVPCAVGLIILSLGYKQIGVRYALPLYPFLIILAGTGAGFLWGLKPNGALAALVFLTWNAVECLAVGPDYLAYFNELAGGPANGYKVLVDSNLDWGQDLKGLASYVKQAGGPEVILSYFGTARPRAYGLTCQGLACVPGLHQESVNSPSPRKEILVVSATNLQGVYYRDHALLDWCKRREPVARIGHTLFVYDVTRDPGAHQWMETIYHLTGEKNKEVREHERVMSLQSE